MLHFLSLSLSRDPSFFTLSSTSSTDVDYFFIVLSLPDIQDFSTISTGYDPLTPILSSGIVFLKAPKPLLGINLDNSPFVIEVRCDPPNDFMWSLFRRNGKKQHRGFLSHTRNAGGDMMECSRGHGLMVIDTCLNMENVFNTVWVYE